LGSDKIHRRTNISLPTRACSKVKTSLLSQFHTFAHSSGFAVIMKKPAEGSLSLPVEVQREEHVLAKVPLVRHRYGFGLVSARDDPVPLKQIVVDTAKEERSRVTVVFAVRNVV
jgi:hypothetical protein